MTTRPRRPAVTPHPHQPDDYGDCWCDLPAGNHCHHLPELADDARAATARILGEREDAE